MFQCLSPGRAAPGGVWLACVGRVLSAVICLGPCAAVAWPLVALLPSCTHEMLMPSFQPFLVVYLGARAAGCCGVVVASCGYDLPG